MKTSNKIYWLKHREAIVVLTVVLTLFFILLFIGENVIDYYFNSI